MPLRWDPLLVRALATELDARLSGGRVRALRLDGDRRDLVLLLRDATLAWSLHPTRGAPLLLPAAEPAEGDLPLAARVRRVHAPADERILVMELLPVRSGEPRDLVVELLGNQWNALVVEAHSRRIRHVLVRREGPRPIKVGETYQAPPPSGREGAEAPVSLERWRALLEPVPPPNRARTLVTSVAWTSPLNAPTLLDGVEEPDAALAAGHAAWASMAFGDAPLEPGLVGSPPRVQPYPWRLVGSEHRPTDSLLEAFALWAEEEDPSGAAGGAEATLPPTLVDRLERAADQAARRVTSLEAQGEGLEDETALRAHADLLLARFKAVPPGASAVELEDFTGQKVTVALDPSLSVQDNASALYDRAARVERARERLPGLIEDARGKAEALESLLSRAREGTVEAEEIRAALPAAPTVSRSGGQDEDILPYRRFRSSGGLEIRVGRGARRNDDLTFHHSAPDDIWLHARHAAGAHVVLRWAGPGNPPARDLYEAAVLAALNSKARTSGQAPVDWTLRKYVRKPRGAAPGAVVPDRVKTVFVEPDEALAERLAED